MHYPPHLTATALAAAAALTAATLGDARAQTAVTQTEPNDSIGTATPTGLTAGSSGGVFSVGNNGDGPYGPTSGDGTGDFDFFSLDALAGQVIIFDTNSNVLGTAVDTLIGIYDSSGTLLDSNDDDGTGVRDSFVRLVAPADGSYFPVVGNWIPGAPDDAGSLPSDPTTPGTGRGAPGGAVDQYEAVILLDGSVYFSHSAPAFPLTDPDNPVDGSVTLTNHGEDTATITALGITGPGADAFRITSTTPISVPPGGSTAIDITFDPRGSADPQEATLEITSNDIIHPTLGIALSERAIAGLLLRLAFDDPPGTPTSSFAAPQDISGNGFQAAYVVNAGAPNFGFGRPPLAGDEGTSVMFNDAGSSGNFVLTANSFPHTATFTYSVWVRPTAGSGEDTLFNRDPNWTLNDAIYGCTIEPGGRVKFRIASSEVVASAPDAVPDDSTHHVVVSHLDTTGFGDFAADRTRLYIDGVLVAENSDSTLEVPDYAGGTNSRLWIATRSAAGTGFNGDMDDFQLYNVELSPDEVLELFENPGTTVGQAPRAPFAITSISRSANGSSVDITWNSRPNRDYTVDSSTDLRQWQEIDDSIPSAGETTTFTDSPPPGTTKIYYRVRQSG